MVVVNESVEVIFVRELSSRNHVCVKLINRDQEFYLVSSYFKYNEEIGIHLHEWDKILRGTKNGPIIFAGDVNAKSPLWNSTTRDNKGEELETFLLANDLVVANEEGNLATYSAFGEVIAGQGPRLMESNIDVTIRNRKVRLEGWMVIDEGNSDHRLIVFNVGGESVRNHDLNREEKGRLMVRHADWKEFDTRLKGFMNDEREYDDVDSGVLDLTTSVLASAEFSMPRAVGKESRTIWWTRELEIERAHVKRVRRQLQRAGDPSVRELSLIHI